MTWWREPRAARPPSRGGPRVRVGALAVAALWLAAALPSAAATAPGASWHARGAFPAVPLEVHAVSCASPTVCVAVGVTSSGTGLVLRSTDAGVHWSSVRVPTGTGELGDVSCATGTLSCEATVLNAGFSAVQVLGSTDGGVHWHAQEVDPIADVGDVETVRCFSALDCVLTGSGQNYEATILLTTDGGVTWRSISPFGQVDNYGIEGVECTTPTTCLVTGWEGGQTASSGVAARTLDGGITWTQEPVPGDVQVVWELACASSTACEAPALTGSGSVVLGTTDGGATWTEQAIPAGASPLFIQCPSATVCFASGYDHTVFNTTSGLLLTTTDTGATWADVALPASSEDAQGLSCTSPTTCVVAGLSTHSFPQLYTVHAGVVSLDPPLASGVVGVESLACGSVDRCVAGGVASTTSLGEVGALLVTSSAGRGWTTVVPQPTADAYWGVTCPTGSVCVALGVAGQGAVRFLVRTTDGGRTWHQVARGQLSITDVSCRTPTSCVAYGGRVLYTSPALHGRWRAGALPKSVLAVLSASCPTAALCVGVGYDQRGRPLDLRSTDGARTWVLERTPSARLQMDSVTCTSASSCVAVGEVLNVFTSSGEGAAETTDDGGLVWHVASVPHAAPALGTVSCLTVVRCLAVGSPDAFSRVVLLSADRGRRFVATASPAGVEYVYDVTCGRSGCWTAGETLTGTTDLEALR